MDIVERLRSVTRLLRKTEETSYEQDDTLASEAADEIEKLRESSKVNFVAFQKAANEIERLREILRWVINLPEDSRIHAKVARKAFALKGDE
jgi:hypothetical protein